MPYSTLIKSMHIACILCCRFCRHCKATNSVDSHRFCVSYKHNGAYFTHTVSFKPYDSYSLHTLNPVWQRCTPVYTDKWVYIIPQPSALCITAKMLFHHSHCHCSTTRFSAKMLFTSLTALHDANRVAPLRTTASTNHRAPWWECRTAVPRS